MSRRRAGFVSSSQLSLFDTAVYSCLTLLSIVTMTCGDIGEQYIGCYQNALEDSALVPEQTTVAEQRQMTLQLCRDKCLKLAKSYFGVLHHYHCYCVDTDYDQLARVDDIACNSYCPGNRSQICGGDDLLSVFSVCPAGQYGSENCNRKCGHCNSTDGNGARCKTKDGECFRGCQDGWQGLQCLTDIDECATNNGNCVQLCANSPGSFICSCRKGFAFNENRRTCDDTNECSVNNASCSQGCTNIYGSFICTCQPGYSLDRDGRTCIDVNECSMNNGGCSHICQNTIGSYHCQCEPGNNIDVDGRTCIASGLTASATQWRLSFRLRTVSLSVASLLNLFSICVL